MPFKEIPPMYHVWHDMRQRCSNPNFRQWKDYGGRGISVCPEWDSFEQFVRDMGARPSRLHSLDRIDNDGDYTPANCRWATRKEQQRNRRDNRRVVLDGTEYLVAELVERFGIKHDTIVARAAKGMTFAQTTAKTRYVDSSGARKAIAKRVANQLAKTHCKHGHPWDDENTRIGRKGNRECRACQRIKVARQRARKEEVARAVLSGS